MKKYSNIQKLTIASCMVLMFALPSFAQMEWRASPHDALGISLNHLKESVQAMEGRNGWLRSEIRILKMKIEQIQRDGIQSNSSSAAVNTSVRPKSVTPIRVGDLSTFSVDDLSGVDSQTNKGYVNISAGLQPSEENGVRPVFADTKDVPTYTRKIRARTAKENDLLRSISQVEAEITDLRRLLTRFPAQAPTDHPMNAELKRKLEVSQEGVRKLEAKLMSVGKRHQGVVEQLHSAKEKNALLKQKHALLAEQYKTTTGEKERLKLAIKRLDSQNQTFINQLQDNILGLKSNGRELEKVLDDATRKIKTNNINFNISEREVELLKENLSVIERENVILKDRHIRLESDWQRLNANKQNK